MDELQSILKTWREKDSSDAVLATVVHVTGSAYRRPGARMLLLPDGTRIGGISGGCLEGEVAKKAWWFTDSGNPVLRVYDTTSDDDAVWEFGLGCNGVVHVLLERSKTFHEALAFIDRRLANSEACAIATVIRGENLGQRYCIDENGLSHGALGFEVRAYSEFVLRDKKSRLVHLPDSDVFIEWIGPPQALVIFGAGHDAIPVADAAKSLGWRVTVADGRPAYTCRERFPSVENVVLMKGDDLLRGIVIDQDTAVVLMTHNYPMDGRLLPQILECKPRYLGMLGPKNRAERLFSELKIDRPDNVYAPVGLDIGCDTPSAIALSIVAEIQSVLGSREGGFLRNRQGSIHSAAEETGAGVLVSETVRPLFCEASQ